MIESIYTKHGEKLGTEGRARADLLQMVFRKGWIRARYNATLRLWYVEVDVYELREENIRNCLQYLIKINKSVELGTKGEDGDLVRIIDRTGVRFEKRAEDLI